MNPLSILVADDEENIRVLLHTLLTREGHTVTTAGSATEAKAVLKAQTFDLIITDILMPDGDGLDLITSAKRTSPAARIMAISGGGRYMQSNDCLRMARGLGAKVVMLKPFTAAELRAGVEQAMGE